MEEQAAPLQPVGTIWDRSPPAAKEEAKVLEWMRPEGGTAHAEPHRRRLGLELWHMRRIPLWSVGRV